jgi:uncharacterized protein with PIN domain
MIIDTSAIIAILTDEPERRTFNEAIERADSCMMSAASFVEASIVIESSRGYDGLRDFDLFLASAGIEIVPVDVEQARTAREAFRRFGKGRIDGYSARRANLNLVTEKPISDNVEKEGVASHDHRNHKTRTRSADPAAYPERCLCKC